ncbi:MAG: lytic transglycosylase domain-containing protein [Solirubrobacteraceae bacterium MAG38_C4-C5]|nr:lytic transglycosylase domain-containing protein [Candidatus Siliceabacter maunaloa]
MSATSSRPPTRRTQHKRKRPPVRGAPGGRRGRAASRRRRLLGLAAVGALAALLAATLLPRLGDVARELTLPLRHADIIRQQAREKDLDAELIAGVIYQESRFRDQTSSAGARGLMQITPETARYIANLSGGTRFVTEDLATPQVNIAYGSFYLRYLLDQYDGDEVVALAAYNGGETNVNRWLAEADVEGRDFEVDAIPFPETRAYVDKVLEARDDYADAYPRELGL